MSETFEGVEIDDLPTHVRAELVKTMSQRLDYTGHWKAGDLRIRARVRLDSYAEQCHAIVECWMPDRGWVEVLTRHPRTDLERGENPWGLPSSYAPGSVESKRPAFDEFATELVADALGVIR